MKLKGIDIIWIIYIIYNYILEKKWRIERIYSFIQFKNNEYLLQLLNIKIYKLSLLGLFMNKILFK